jgi:hypothetical protein
MNEREAARRISSDLGIAVDNFADYSDGFSFTVTTELEAYKAAYKYQGSKRVVVKEAPIVSGWLVQVYSK